VGTSCAKAYAVRARKARISSAAECVSRTVLYIAKIMKQTHAHACFSIAHKLLSQSVGYSALLTALSCSYHHCQLTNSVLCNNNNNNYHCVLSLQVPPGGYGLVFTDGAKFGRGEQLHLGLLALWEFQAQHGRLPEPGNTAEAEVCRRYRYLQFCNIL
jgi:Ubiquitin-activating enzyme E1 four-helix bundle